MKPKEKKPEEVYRIIDRESGEPVGSYSRAYCNEYDFTSVEQARRANCHDLFKDKVKYKIAKYRVTYELIEDDADPATEDEFKKWQKDKDLDEEILKEAEDKGITDPWEMVAYKIKRKEEKQIIRVLTEFLAESNNKKE